MVAGVYGENSLVSQFFREAMVRMLPRLAGYSKPSPCLWHGATILLGWLGNSTRIAIAQLLPNVTVCNV
jgi:hypothetical protein